MPVSKHPDYELVVTHEDPTGNQNLALAVRDKTRRTYGRMMLKELGKLDGINLVSNLFLLPKEEVERLFEKNADIEKELSRIFTQYCMMIQADMSPNLRELRKGRKTYIEGYRALTYEDVYRGLGEYISLAQDAKKQETLSRLKKMSNARN